MIWRYSKWDSVPFVMTAFQLVFNFWLAATWNTHNMKELTIFWIMGLFLFWYNGLVASHNFVHTPWFSKDLLNHLYSAINSVNLGAPFSHYRYQHLNHHCYVNDRKDLEGRTKDGTSTFAYGKNGNHENPFTYSTLGLFRDDFGESFREAKRRRELKQLRFEIVFCISGLVILALINWKYFLAFYVPIFYIGWVLEHVENY